IGLRQIRSTAIGERRHSRRPVRSALHSDQSYVFVTGRDTGRICDELDSFARDAHSNLELRTDSHPLYEPSHRRGEKRIVLVSAVVADLVAEQATGNADSRLGSVAGHR